MKINIDRLGMYLKNKIAHGYVFETLSIDRLYMYSLSKLDVLLAVYP